MIRASRVLIFAVVGILWIAGGFWLLQRGPGDGDKDAQDPSGARPELALGRSEEYDYDPPEPGSYQLPAWKAAGDGQVLGEDGEPRRLKELLEGRITILSFIYSRCADPTACPMATAVLSQIQGVSRKDTSLAENLQLITFSFDPEYDTPELMARYRRQLGERRSGSDWMFLTSSNLEVLRPILDAYGQRVSPRNDPDHPLGPFNHMLRVYLIDRDAMIRNVYSSGMLDPRLVVTDVRTLLLDEES
jgi:cytochrome oxidase Cu insertion factor (SCO1/SenC/PrrC family)